MHLWQTSVEKKNKLRNWNTQTQWESLKYFEPKSNASTTHTYIEVECVNPFKSLRDHNHPRTQCIFSNYHNVLLIIFWVLFCFVVLNEWKKTLAWANFVFDLKCIFNDSKWRFNSACLWAARKELVNTHKNCLWNLIFSLSQCTRISTTKEWTHSIRHRDKFYEVLLITKDKDSART